MNTNAVFNTMSRLERQMGVDVGLKDTAEHLYRPFNKPSTRPLTSPWAKQQNTARNADKY